MGMQEIEETYEIEEMQEDEGMPTTDVIQSLDYLLRKIFLENREVTLNVDAKAIINLTKIRSYNSFGTRWYEIGIENYNYVYVVPSSIKLIRFDVISDIVTSYEKFKIKLDEVEMQTGKQPFMVHFMAHDEERSGGLVLTVKIL